MKTKLDINAVRDAFRDLTEFYVDIITTARKEAETIRMDILKLNSALASNPAAKAFADSLRETANNLDRRFIAAIHAVRDAPPKPDAFQTSFRELEADVDVLEQGLAELRKFSE